MLQPLWAVWTLKTAFLSEITAVCVSINKWCIEISKVLLFWFLIMETYGNIQQNSKATHLKLIKKYGTHFHQIQFGAYIFIGKISISGVILKSIIWEFSWFWAKSKPYMIETNRICPYRDKVKAFPRKWKMYFFNLNLLQRQKHHHS